MKEFLFTVLEVVKTAEVLPKGLLTQAEADS